MSRRQSMHRKLVIKEGFLAKSPSGKLAMLKSWERRWFVFSTVDLQPFLECYPDPQAMLAVAPIESIPLTGCQQIISKMITVDSRHPHSFNIILSDRILSLAAETRSEMVAWCKVLQEKLEWMGYLTSAQENVYEVQQQLSRIDQAAAQQAQAVRRAHASAGSEETEAAVPQLRAVALTQCPREGAASTTVPSASAAMVENDFAPRRCPMRVDAQARENLDRLLDVYECGSRTSGNYGSSSDVAVTPVTAGSGGAHTSFVTSPPLAPQRQQLRSADGAVTVTAAATVMGDLSLNGGVAVAARHAQPESGFRPIDAAPAVDSLPYDVLPMPRPVAASSSLRVPAARAPAHTGPQACQRVLAFTDHRVDSTDQRMLAAADQQALPVAPARRDRNRIAAAPRSENDFFLSRGTPGEAGNQLKKERAAAGGVQELSVSGQQGTKAEPERPSRGEMRQSGSAGAACLPSASKCSWGTSEDGAYLHSRTSLLAQHPPARAVVAENDYGELPSPGLGVSLHADKRSSFDTDVMCVPPPRGEPCGSAQIASIIAQRLDYQATPTLLENRQVNDNNGLAAYVNLGKVPACKDDQQPDKLSSAVTGDPHLAIQEEAGTGDDEDDENVYDDTLACRAKVEDERSRVSTPAADRGLTDASSCVIGDQASYVKAMDSPLMYPAGEMPVQFKITPPRPRRQQSADGKRSQFSKAHHRDGTATEQSAEAILLADKATIAAESSEYMERPSTIFAAAAAAAPPPLPQRLRLSSATAGSSQKEDTRASNIELPSRGFAEASANGDGRPPSLPLKPRKASPMAGGTLMLGGSMLKIPAGAAAEAKLTPVRQSQISELLDEVNNAGGVKVSAYKKEVAGNICFVDVDNRVWIAGWNQKSQPLLQKLLHVGDEVLSVNHEPVTSSSMLARCIRTGDSDRKLSFILRRLPLASVHALRRRYDGEDLGIRCHDGTPEVDVVVPGGLAHASGLKARAMPGDSLRQCNWFLTEINNRPVSLFFKNGEVEPRLSAFGKDVTLVLQPCDFITKLKKQLKTHWGYKNYIVQ